MYDTATLDTPAANHREFFQAHQYPGRCTISFQESLDICIADGYLFRPPFLKGDCVPFLEVNIVRPNSPRNDVIAMEYRRLTFHLEHMRPFRQ